MKHSVIIALIYLALFTVAIPYQFKLANKDEIGMLIWFLGLLAFLPLAILLAIRKPNNMIQ